MQSLRFANHNQQCSDMCFRALQNEDFNSIKNNLRAEMFHDISAALNWLMAHFQRSGRGFDHVSNRQVPDRFDA